VAVAVLRRMALCVFSDVSMESDGNDGLPRETADSESGAHSRGQKLSIHYARSQESRGHEISRPVSQFDTRPGKH